MDRCVIDQNSSYPRRTRTLPPWLSAFTSTSGTESQKNRGNDTSKIAEISSPVTVKTEFTECDDDIMSVCSSTDPESIDVKPKVEDISSSSVNPEVVDVMPKVENSPSSSSTYSESVDIKPKVDELSLCSSTIPEPADVKPKAEEIPIETVFVEEGDDTEFMREDSATKVGTADSTKVDDCMLSDNDEIVPETTEPAKECKTESSTSPQCSSSNISASVTSTPSAVSTSTNNPVPSSRRMCIYRHKCYRINPQHKQDFSHPGDVDYDGKSECDSTSGDSVSKPRCWYGSNCYRRSEEHRQKFYHSPSNSRKRNATRTRRENRNNGDDSDAYDDSFIDDNSEDNCEASEDEETEFSDFDSASSSDEDSYRDLGKSKKKKFNIL